MKRNRSIRVKATILLVIFSLNTIIGFACSVGLKKFLAASDHHNTKEAIATIHVHADGKKHVHYKKAESRPVVHIHADGKRHIHHEKASKRAENTSYKPDDIASQNDSREEKSKCCTTKVTELEQLDKCLPQPVKFNPVFFTTVITDFFNIDILYTSYINTNIKFFVRSYHPPILNIRIAIRSFQI